MATKQKIVTELFRDELWLIVDEYRLPVDDRRRLDHLHAAVRRLPKSELRDILLNLDRDRLKEICRALDLDDSGRNKSDIVSRLLGIDADDEEDSSSTDPTSTPAFDPAYGSHPTPSPGSYPTPQPGSYPSLSPGQYPLTGSYPTPVPGSFSTPMPGPYSGQPQAPYPRPSQGPFPGSAQGSYPTPSAILLSATTMPRAARSRLFIGSTVEALVIARWLQAELDHEFEVTLWNQNLFEPGDWTWSRLVQMARTEFDFAILVFSGDDVVQSRGASSLAPRDNVLLEYGLFVGTIGPARTFFLYNRDHPPKIGSDLAGVTALTYGDRDDGNQQAAVGPACTRLIERRTKLGRIVRS